jgi:biopolymer transport protein ExbB
MVPILLGSLVAIAVMVERYIVIRRARKGTERVAAQVFALLNEGDRTGAMNRCKSKGTPVGQVLLAGLEAGEEPERSKEIMALAGQVELDQLEKRMGWISMVAVAAPLVGFLGTVTGMIRAFMQVQAHAGQVDSSVLAGGIWEALVTTAAGLAVGIIALVGHNWLIGHIEGLTHQLRRASMDLLRFLSVRAEEHVNV